MSVDQAQRTQPRGSIGRQIQLPLKKAIEISFKSIKIRFWRSMITAMGIFLGIAFFSSVRMSGEFANIQRAYILQIKEDIEKGLRSPSIEDTRLIALLEENQEERQASENRMLWLSIMGLLVCTVGITNSMLMSVTERYKEIGTMKCLGALDSFIVKLFFIESTLLGFIASLLGFLLGWMLISLINLFTQGVIAFGGNFWLASLKLMLLSVSIGTLLTFLATIFPAIRAAKMPPSAALRVEI